MASRMRSSNEIWNFFTKVDGTDKAASCNQCSKQLSYKTSITNLKTHLKLKHIGHYNRFSTKCKPAHTMERTALPQLSVSTSLQTTTAYKEEKIPQMENETDAVSAKRQRMAQSKAKKPLRPDEKKHIDAMLLKFIARTYQPFSIVEENDFIEFVEALNLNYILPGRKTISERLIPFLYNKCLENQKQLMNEEAVSVCLTTDCWTSAAMDAYIDITAHFINTNYEFKTVLLKCCQVHDAQTSSHLASILRNTAQDWNLQGKINFIVTDNSTNSVNAINELGWDHCGCIAHKLNLVLQSVLKLFEPILKKVRKIVNHYCSSYKAKEKLQEYQVHVMEKSNPLVLINSVATQWNSTYCMLKRFIELQDAVRATVPSLGTDLPAISVEEWQALNQFLQILKPFEQATRELSAEKYMCGSKAIPLINGLFDVLEELKKKPDYLSTIITLIEHLKRAMSHRFEGIESNLHLAICTLLDPRYKITMFLNEESAEATRRKVINIVQDMMIAEHQSKDNYRNTSDFSQSLNYIGSGDAEIDLWRRRNMLIKKKEANPNPKTATFSQQEVESYLNDDFADNLCDPCNWWRSNGYKYPHLSKIFLEKCNLVATSVTSEKIFSKADYTITDGRTRLSANQAEQLVFLNANLKNTDYRKLMQ